MQLTEEIVLTHLINSCYTHFTTTVGAILA